jgi:prophage maintenance system killer protein
MMRYLTTAEMISLARDHLGAAFGLRDRGLVDLAAARPQWTAYPTLSQKAAVLLRSLVTSYPFIDQNKRIGLLVTGVFVMANGGSVPADRQEEEYRLVCDIAAGRASDVKTIARRLAHLWPMDVDRPVAPAG